MEFLRSKKLYAKLKSYSASNQIRWLFIQAELLLQIISPKELDYDAQVDLQDSSSCPTSTPLNKNNENRTYLNAGFLPLRMSNILIYAQTPQTSPPRPTPVKSTLSETELASIPHTDCVVSSLSAVLF